ncbi:NHL repeat-containing protein 2 [Osmia bicornis bicornis]|uniref:NHL repeat-containing protein 2 n=1 Tax=Osmia bicornis bicornis TaxID=1437191 RepID=UPI0010F5ED8A|nr:NHL repeat-containing protein 2 [Osmia bicornis bicornis]
MFRKKIPKTSNEENSKDKTGANVVETNRKEHMSLTESEKHEYLQLSELERILDQELSDLTIQEKEFSSTEETMDLLHKYNDIKDITQAVMGTIAVSNGTTVRRLEWFNVTEGLSVYQHLVGKIIILDFFTYCCINCMHILPDLHALEERFTIKDGLVVVGVHSGKFTNERDSKGLLSAIQRYNITHPVVNDATLSTWRNLGISCWPTLVMIGPLGELLAVFVGEGHREELKLYTDVALTYFKSLNKISEHDVPLQLARHLLPVGGNEALLFPSKLETFQIEQGEKLIISDTGNNRILVTDMLGKVEYVIGGSNPDFRDGDFQTARFNAPQGVCILGSWIFVADNENHAVRKIDLTRKIVTTVAGTGVQGFDRIGGKSGKDQLLSSPWDVAIFNHEYDNKIVPVLLVAMAGIHQIWAVFLENTVWWKNKEYKADSCVAIVGNGREENRNNAYPHAAGFAQPSGLTIDQRNKIAYIADSESSAIRRIDLQNGRVSVVCGGNKNPAVSLKENVSCNATYIFILCISIRIHWNFVSYESPVDIAGSTRFRGFRRHTVYRETSTSFGNNMPFERERHLCS